MSRITRSHHLNQDQIEPNVVVGAHIHQGQGNRLLSAQLGWTAPELSPVTGPHHALRSAHQQRAGRPGMATARSVRARLLTGRPRSASFKESATGSTRSAPHKADKVPPFTHPVHGSQCSKTHTRSATPFSQTSGAGRPASAHGAHLTHARSSAPLLAVAVRNRRVAPACECHRSTSDWGPRFLSFVGSRRWWFA